MSWLFRTPADIRTEAHVVRRHADDLRATATRLAAVAEGTQWRSTAAAAYRRRVRVLAHDLDRCAERLEHAARALDRHAAGVGGIGGIGSVGHAALQVLRL